MTYKGTNLFECNGHKVLLSAQASSAGYHYPQLAVEKSNGEHLVIDLVCGDSCLMRQEEWDEWMAAKENTTIEEAKKYLSDFIDFDSFARLVETL